MIQSLHISSQALTSQGGIVCKLSSRYRVIRSSQWILLSCHNSLSDNEDDAGEFYSTSERSVADEYCLAVISFELILSANIRMLSSVEKSDDSGLQMKIRQLSQLTIKKGLLLIFDYQYFFPWKPSGSLCQYQALDLWCTVGCQQGIISSQCNWKILNELFKPVLNSLVSLKSRMTRIQWMTITADISVSSLSFIFTYAFTCG